jgi:hypothetical protein
VNKKSRSTRCLSPAPKKGCQSVRPLTMPTLNRPVRIKKSGRPHEQVWVRSTAAEYESGLRMHAAATLDEMMCQVTRASLSPSHYSFLNRPNRFDFSGAAVKLRDLCERCRPAFAVPIKRVVGAVMTLIALAQASSHRPESFW